MNAATLSRKFSLERSWYLLYNRIRDELVPIGIGIAVIVANNILSLLFAKGVAFNEGSAMIWGIIIVGAGLILASQSFKGMHDGKAGTDWLLLPATPFEKYLAVVVDYLVIFPLAASAISMGLSALFSVVAVAIGGQGGKIWTPALMGGFKAWLVYASVATLFIAGSASFRKVSLLKTIAVAAGYVLAMASLFFGLGWLVYKGNGFNSSNISFANGSISINGGSIPASVEEALTWIYRIACYAILPIFALVYGYFRVFEKEARDEVQ
jgi:hypothetical protein